MSYQNYLKSIGTSVKNFILRRKIIEKPIYVTKTPDIDTIRELGKFMDRKKSIENIDLKKKLLKAESKLEEKDREKERILEEKEIMERIRKQKEHMKELEKARALKLKFVGLLKSPTLFSKSNIPLGNIQGMYLKETKDGYLLFYPWLESKKNTTKILKEPVTDFKSFFRKEIGIVSQMRGGKVDSNYDLDEYGKLMFLPPKKLDVDNQYKIINLSDLEVKDYETQIEQLRNQIRENYAKIKDMKKREVEFEVQIAENEVLMDASVKERGIYASQYALLIKKQEGLYKEMLMAVSEVEDVKTRAVLSEKLANTMESALEEYKTKYEEAVSMELSDIEREKIIEMQDDIVKNTEKMLDKVKGLASSKKPVVVGGIKKEAEEEGEL